MKKQYLISLLGLVAMFIPLGNIFIETNSSNSIINTDKLQKTYEDEYFNYSIEQISMGGAHSAAVVNDGTQDGDSLYTWGDNHYGQLGLGDDFANDSYNTPQEVTELPNGNIEEISMGAMHSSAIVDGDLYTWGKNKTGQLGVGKDQEIYNVPQSVDELNNNNNNVEQISMGGIHSSAIVDGNLYTWGDNSEGQLGLGDTTNYNTPQEVTGLPNGNIKQISMGGLHSSTIINGDLYTWGDNNNGQLGLGGNYTEKNYNTPQPVTYFDDKGEIEQISMGGFHSSAIINRDLYTWGSNLYGQLGIEGIIYSSATPKKVTFFDKDGETPINKEIEQISMGGIHSAAILEGDLYTWGQKDILGYQNNEKVKENKIPHEVTELNTKGNIEQISMGGIHSSAIVEGNLYTWGYNTRGQLGLGGDYSENNYNTPQKVETSFPYFTNALNDSVNETDPKNIVISYEFETNLAVETVTTNLTPSKEGISYSSNPDQKGESEVYKGTQTISSSEIVEGGEYSYSLDLNYKDASENNQVLKDFSSGTFNLAALEQEPEITAKNVVKDVDDPQHKASVDYTVTEGGTDPDGNILTLDEVVWMELNADGQGNDKQLASSKENDKPNALTGTLTCDELEPNKNYENTILIAKYNEDGGKWDTQDEVNPFQMESAATQTTITLAEIDHNKTRKRRATIDYEIDLGTNADGKGTKITSIKWIDNDSGNTLATSRTNEAKGYLTAKGLTPDTSYNNTTLVVELDEGEVDPKAVDGNLKTESAGKDTTVEITKQPEAGEITETSASVSYEVDRGRDSHGGPKYTVENVEWIDLNDDNKVLASSSDSSGTLTAEGLIKGTTYNTELKITMSKGGNPDNLSVDPFTTDLLATDLNEIPTMTNEEVVLLSSTSASVDYTVEKGNSPYEITKVQWMNGTTELASSTDLSGTLTATGLTEDTTYDKTTLVLTYGQTGSVTNNVTSFKTGVPMTDIDSIPKMTNEEVVLLSSTSASVDYTVEKGNSPYEITKVQWMNGTTELASSTDLSGTLTATGLTEDTTYDKTTLVLTYGQTGTVTNNVTSFKTGVPMTDIDSIPKMENEEVVLLSSTSASINYTVDKNNSPYEITKVQWMNGRTELASSTDLSGTLTATDLIEDTTYDKTTLVLTYEQTGIVTNNVTSFKTGIPMTDIDPIVPLDPSTSNGMSWKIVTLIIIGAIALIALFSGILTWLSKGNKEDN